MSEQSPPLSVSQEKDIRLVEFTNSKILDEANITEIGAQLNALIDQSDSPKVLLDFQSVDHLSSAALGMLINVNKDEIFRTDRLPAFNQSPKDVAGAGDSFFTSASMALCVGADIWRSSYLGALAAALQVSRVGNTPLTSADLIAEIDDRRFDAADHV